MPSINDQYPYVPKLNPCQFGTSGYDLEVCDLLTGSLWNILHWWNYFLEIDSLESKLGVDNVGFGRKYTVQ